MKNKKNNSKNYTQIHLVEPVPANESDALPLFAWAGWAQECPECDRFGTNVSDNKVYCKYCNTFLGFLNLRAER